MHLLGQGVAFRNRKSPFPAVPVQEAQAMVWQQAETLGQEIVPFQDALDRILAEDVVASDPLPPFRASIKDGYAVLSTDRDGVRAVLGASHAGAGVGQRLAAGSCVRITTGAPVPEEADAVVQVEDTELVEHDSVSASCWIYLRHDTFIFLLTNSLVDCSVDRLFDWLIANWLFARLIVWLIDP